MYFEKFILGLQIIILSLQIYILRLKIIIFRLKIIFLQWIPHFPDKEKKFFRLRLLFPLRKD